MKNISLLIIIDIKKLISSIKYYSLNEKNYHKFYRYLKILLCQIILFEKLLNYL